MRFCANDAGTAGRGIASEAQPTEDVRWGGEAEPPTEPPAESQPGAGGANCQAEASEGHPQVHSVGFAAGGLTVQQSVLILQPSLYSFWAPLWLLISVGCQRALHVLTEASEAMARH